MFNKSTFGQTFLYLLRNFQLSRKPRQCSFITSYEKPKNTRTHYAHKIRRYKNNEIIEI